MKKSEVQKHSAAPHQRLSFQSRLECIASGMDYFALSVPMKITHALRTRGPVPVFARVNDSETFLASLYPVGGGRHYLRIKNKICSAVKIKQGDRVRVQITVRDRSAEISIPKDLTSALRAEGAEEEFKALPIGKKSYLLRLIDEAAKPQTRDKRIQAAVEEAHRKMERGVGRQGVPSTPRGR
jgi:hypothetical protein